MLSNSPLRCLARRDWPCADELDYFNEQRQPRLVQTQRRVGRAGDRRRTKRVLVRRSTGREILQRRLLGPAA